MAFYFECEHCKKRMKVPKSVAGKEIRCFNCRQRTFVPAPVSRENQSILEQSLNDLVPKFVRRTFLWLEPKIEYLAPPFSPAPLVYLLFVILLLPLLVLHKPQNEFQKRIQEITKQAQEMNSDTHREVSIEYVFSGYPDQKVPGALLPRNSKVHWVFGAMAWMATLTFILLIFPRGTASLLQLSTVALFTATVGIAGLLFLQLLAAASFGMVGMVGWMWIVAMVLRLFAIAYLLAFLPGTNFWASLFGFIVSVGVCEEFFKALPFLSQTRHMHKTSYQTICIWGLASGMGFGVAEGLFYCSKFYNGIAPGGVYIVRFTSCVAIHSILTAAVALMFYKNDRLISHRSWVSWGVVVICSLAPSAVLHGLYDTLLKHELAPGALFVAVLSFIWLAFQIEVAHGMDEQQQILDAEELATEAEPQLAAAVAGVLPSHEALLATPRPSKVELPSVEKSADKEDPAADHLTEEAAEE